MTLESVCRRGAVAIATVCFVATGSLIASVCCKYTYTWPADGNPGPEGPCSGSISTACESGAPAATPDDPLARLTFGTRPANCRTIFLDGSQYFIRAACSQPPAGTVLVGVLPDGQCCFAGGLAPPQPMLTPQSFYVSNCTDDCPDPSGSED